MTFRIGLVILSCLCFSACSNLAPIKSTPTSSRVDSVAGKLKPVSSSLKRKLLDQYKQWRGTPYLYGGLSKKGIDCSGFVFLTFKDQLGITIPRTTAQQSKIGRLIDHNQIKIGDLLFFRTEVKLRHVGIYVGDQQFMHASTNGGVMLSSLNNPYWEKHFWKTQRVKSSLSDQ